MENKIEQYWESVPRKTKGWFKEFVKSERFNSLSEQQKMYAENVIMVFSETVYNMEFETPEEWDDHGVRCCCPGIFTMQPIDDEKFFKAVTPVLSQFFEFLYEKGYKDNGQELAQNVRELEMEIMRRLDYRRKYVMNS